jgi:hypothetical protein
MFEAGVRSGDVLCITNPFRPQDNFIGARLTVLRSMHDKGIARVNMAGVEETKDRDSFEELSYKSPTKDPEEEKQSKGGIFSRFIPKFSGFKAATIGSGSKEKSG